MVVRLKYLTCSKHICRRIADSLGLHDSLLFLPLLSLKKTQEPNSIGFEIPIKSLQNVCSVTDIKPILNINHDTVINKIYENNEKESIYFDLRLEELLKCVLFASSPTDNEPLVKKRTILVEYSSPNIAKPFHVGHLRSTIVGNYVANILAEFSDVKRLNYLGDWGTQIGLVKAGLDSTGMGDVSILENPMREMYAAYTLANSDPKMLEVGRQIFYNLEKGSPASWNNEWEKIRSVTIEHLKKTYALFEVKFDEYSFESNYRSERIAPVMKRLEENKLLSTKNGCLVLNADGKDVPLFKSDGTSLYLARDIAAALDRIEKFKCDSMMYVVDKSQADHLGYLKFVIQRITHKDLIHYVPFGRVSGMSTRRGTSVFLDDILDETVHKMSEQQLKSPNTRTFDPKVTQTLGVTALIIYILKQRRMRDFKFSWENALQSRGDSGVKLQYTHSRLHSLERTNSHIPLPGTVDPAALSGDLVIELVYQLARFPDVVRDSRELLESSFLVKYLFDLCNVVSRCLSKLPVKGAPGDLASQRLLLFHASRNTLAAGMEILGLKPLTEM